MREGCSGRLCRICGNAEGNRSYRLKEAMFGLGEVFEYIECGACGCLQIADIPADMAAHYPRGYYSFLSSPEGRAGGVRNFLAGVRNRSYLTRRGLAGPLLGRWFPNEPMRLVGLAGLRADSRILDVGCGSGSLLNGVKEAGFNHVLGIDPFLDRDIRYASGLELRKLSIHQVTGEWDVVMFHHSFEHAEDPLGQLMAVSRLLSPGGVCLIRIPTVSSYAWHAYRTHWVQLDPPRHLHLHSLRSMEVMCERAGLQRAMTIFDSDEFQFCGSEDVARGIPLESETSYFKNRSLSGFSPHAIAAFKEKARFLNALGWGDQAAFYLRKRDPAIPASPAEDRTP
jgi:SAM-dependent methyltransferase